MPSLSSLLKQFEAITTQIAQLEAERDSLRAEIVAAANEPKPRARSTKAEAVAVVRDLVKLLRESSTPLPRSELAQRLNLTLPAVAYRIKCAMALKFIERTQHGMYCAVVAVSPVSVA